MLKRIPKTEDATFISEKPCRKGHLGLRYLLRSRCVQCARERASRHYRANPEIAKKRASVHRRHPEMRERDKEKYQRNKQICLERVGRWRRENKERVPGYQDRYRRKNLAKFRMWGVNRIERVRRATPPWADMKRISDVYQEAQRINKATGILHSVDHIVPICGKNVCGLHVHENLRVIPYIENARKGNRLIDELVA